MRKKNGNGFNNGFDGMRATVLGLARQGTALAKFLASRGARVTVSDVKGMGVLQEQLTELAGWPINFILGGHPPELLDTDVLFVSAGVSPDIPILVEARRRGTKISSDTELFFELCEATIIGITGSSGKTTTATLIGEMLQATGQKTWVGGNIGWSLINRVDRISRDDLVVLELSSFQLEGLRRSPHIAVVLNITPNHLDRHRTMKNYIKAKTHILRHQRAGDVAILGYDNDTARDLASLTGADVFYFSARSQINSGACLQDGNIVIRQDNDTHIVCSVSDIRLPGEHNIQNVLAACATAFLAGASLDAIRWIATSFTGVEHRLEPVRERRGVRYVNDSIATSPERTMAALRSFDAPIILLAGGYDKKLPMEDLAQLIVERTRHLILFGEAAPLIEQAVLNVRPNGAGPDIQRFLTMEEAVAAASRIAQPGEVVLLSPACASYDAFQDFVERGQRFKRIVKNLPA
jgi:UDP-N-acetylmuramoylalanine--D-glutamate ligase